MEQYEVSGEKLCGGVWKSAECWNVSLKVMCVEEEEYADVRAGGDSS